MQVPQNQNSEVDEVAMQASSKEGSMPLNLKIEVQKYPSIEEFYTLGVQSQNG